MVLSPPSDLPHSPPSWIPVTCGIAVGISILSLLLGPMWRAVPSPDAPVPPRVPLNISSSALDPLEASRLLVDAVIQVESHGDPTLVGGVGERGLMQIREGTWKDVTTRHYGRPIPFDRAFEPALNREVGRLYLGDLQVSLYQYQDQWKSDLRSLLLASYNAGPDRVREAGYDLRNLPEAVQSYAGRASALHDWYLGDHSEEMRQRLIEAGEVP